MLVGCVISIGSVLDLVVPCTNRFMLGHSDSWASWLISDYYHATIPYNIILYATIIIHYIPYLTTAYLAPNLPHDTLPHHTVPCLTLPCQIIPHHTLQPKPYLINRSIMPRYMAMTDFQALVLICYPNSVIVRGRGEVLHVTYPTSM